MNETNSTNLVSETPRLLIVDDETAQMKALCDTLGEQGYLTTGFTSSREALDSIRGRKFDLVLTDLMMPELDGIAFLKAALQADPDLIGIIMTGEGTIATAVEAMKMGALDYILKPFKLSVILPVLSRALAVRRLRVENQLLEQHVRERTIALEAANKELEAFSYSVSHDLRGPLRHITFCAETLQESHRQELSAEALGFVNRIRAGAGRMAQLIEDLLRLSRLGRQNLFWQRVNISELVREVLDELRKDSPQRSPEVRITELHDCMGDPSLLKQVFLNLLSNAFKFTRNKEQALIEIGSETQADLVEYFVRDNGAGFDMKYAGKLFGVFQRLHHEREFEGTGIGLSIVQRIIHRHNGRIRAEGEDGKGAVFHFTLPIPSTKD